MASIDLEGVWHWLRRMGTGGLPRVPVRRVPRVRTQFSSTVFSGDARDWVDYLNLPFEQRHDGRVRVAIEWDRHRRRLEFQAENDYSRALSDCLRQGFEAARHLASQKPFVAQIIDDLIFGNASNGLAPLGIRSSTRLPSDAAREVRFSDALEPLEARIVLNQSLVTDLLPRWQHRDPAADQSIRLGLAWPGVFRVLLQLGYPNYPRDRFVEKIDLTARLAIVTVNLLHQGRREGRLIPNAAGEVYRRYIAQRDDVDPAALPEANTWFRLLEELSYALDEQRCRDYRGLTQFTVREFLDERYLRLSLAGVMPDVSQSMAPMPTEGAGKRIKTPSPVVGRYGIVDGNDLAAWKKVHKVFREMGYILVGQLGIGQFARVYEALNLYNPNFPPRVALKVDRIEKGRKKEAIQHVDVTMRIGRDLAEAPHVIRIFDAGKLKGKRFTYHVLQLVDGDTLDHLAGVAGREHSSMLRPVGVHLSADDAQREAAHAVKLSHGEAWRRQRMFHQFTERLTLSQTLDLLTSVLLWLEEIHHLGYAINDLKNGNLMLSRRGQLKGIDLDAYSPIFSPLDKLTDFYFLAVSLALLLVNLADCSGDGAEINPATLQDSDALRRIIGNRWPLGDVANISSGRVQTPEVLDLLIELIAHGRDRTYLDNPSRFTADIDQLIYLKRRIFLEEIVLD